MNNYNDDSNNNNFDNNYKNETLLVNRCHQMIFVFKLYNYIQHNQETLNL